MVLAGAPAHNAWVYHRTRFWTGDPVVWLRLPAANGARWETHSILRDIELERAAKMGVAEHVHAPAEFTPEGGLSGDRETAFAQATAEMLRKRGLREVWTDRSLPMLFV